MRVGTTAARLGGIVVLALGALLVAPAAHAEPDAPDPDRLVESIDYYSGAFLTGSKERGTDIELELEDGSTPDCDGGHNHVFVNWQCGIDYSHFWPRAANAPATETVRIYARDNQGERSAPATVTLVFRPSAFAITTAPNLPTGDVAVIRGAKEMGARVEWTLDGPSGAVFSNPRLCDDGGDVESQFFTCMFVTSKPGPGRARTAAAAALVPDGSYTATFNELRGTLQIDQIVFDFTVGTPTGPTASPAPTAAPSGTAAPTPGQTPTHEPSSAPSSDADDPTPSETPSATPTPTDSTSATPTPTTPASPTDAGESPSGDVSIGPLEPVDPVAAPIAPQPNDILPFLLLAVLVFTVMGLLGVPGLATGGRFAPGSTRTGGGAVPVGRWPQADARAAQRTAHSAGGLTALGAGEVGTADESAGTEGRLAEGWGDRSPTWRAPGHEALDAAAASLPSRLAPRWPLLARLVDDGTPLRAVLGSLSVAFPLAGLVLGAYAATTTDGLPLAPGLALATVLLALGLLDAMAGVAAVVGFTTLVVLSSGLTADGLGLGQGLRGLAGVAALWFVVPLLAGAARPFRRIRAAGQVYAWDRAADTLIAALVSGWAVQGLVGSLGDLVGRTQPLTEHADALGLMTVGLVVGRFGLEELAARAYPRRLTEVHTDDEPEEPSLTVQLRGLVVRAGFLAFFAWAFLGSCWQLWAGVAVFALPYALAVVHERIPDLPALAFTVPRGVVETLVLVVVGAVLAYWIDGSSGEDPTEALRNGFVVLAVPASALGVLGVLGGEPPAQRWTWPRQLAGAAVVAATVLVVLVWL